MADLISHEAPAHEATALPVMLPGKLVGRDQTLAAVYGGLKQNQPVLLYGPAGIGKTALAATLASAYTQQAGGALWLNVDEDTLASLIVRVGRAFGDMDIATSENPTGMIGATTALLAQQKPLVVLDGNPMLPAATEFINKIAPGLPLMITTETAPASGPWQAIKVPALDASGAATLFTEKSGVNTPEVAEIVALLDHHPFSIVMAAGTARVAKLDGPTLLNALKTLPADLTPSTRALTLGFRTLQQGLQGILLRLGATFEGQASLEMLSQISGAATETIQKVMTILAAAGFAQVDSRYNEPYYSLHPLALSYIQGVLKQGGQLGALQERVKDIVLDYARKYTAPDESAHNKLAAEMDAFLAVAHWAAEKGERDVASQFMVALTQADGFVNKRGYRHELLQLQEFGSSGMSAFPANAELPAALAMFAEDDEDDDLYYDEDEDDDIYDYDDADLEDAEDEDEAPPPLSPFASAPLGAAAPSPPSSPPAPEDMLVGTPTPVDPTNADSLRMAIAEAKQEGDDMQALSLQTTLGELLVSQDKATEALSVYDEILVSQEEADDKAGMLATLKALVPLMAATGNTQATILHANRGTKLAEELDDKAALITMQTALGDARQQLGESADAIVAYSRALEQARSSGDQNSEATILTNLGFAQLDDDETETAIQTWNDALTLCRSLQRRDIEGRILGGLGTAHGDLERWQEAINYHTSALYISREVKDAKEEALQLGNLGYASKQAGKLGDAVLRYRQALHLAYDRSERENIVSTIVDLVNLLSQSKSHLSIAKMLIEDAVSREGTDREVSRLKERIDAEMVMASSEGVTFKDVKGTAQDYAKLAYDLLDA